MWMGWLVVMLFRVFVLVFFYDWATSWKVTRLFMSRSFSYDRSIWFQIYTGDCFKLPNLGEHWALSFFPCILSIRNRISKSPGLMHASRANISLILVYLSRLTLHFIFGPEVFLLSGVLSVSIKRFCNIFYHHF